MSVPFTPGIIPKRQPQLAKALGKAVGEQLFTKNDLKNMLMSDDIRESVVGVLMQKMKESGAGEKDLKESIQEFVPGYLYEQSRKSIEDTLVRTIQNGIEGMDIGAIICKEGKRVVQEKLSGSMMGMFVNDSLIDSVAEPIGGYVENYIREHGDELIRPVVEEQLNKGENHSVSDLMNAIAVSDGMLQSILRQMYDKIMNGGLDTLLEKLDICGIVESKVNMMNPENIEALVLTVMKNELNMVVRLGALIGAVIGLWNGLF
jgi:uncharacterized membrane protein YheB (UPF0754 family)